MLCYPFHLDADSSRGLAQCQNGVVLGSVQPVDSQFSAGGPFHHGDVILTPGKHAKWLNNTDKTLGEKITFFYFSLRCLLLVIGYRRRATVRDITHPIRGSSGFFITTVCRGPFRLTTDRYTTGFSSPACRDRQEISDRSHRFQQSSSAVQQWWLRDTKLK